MSLTIGIAVYAGMVWLFLRFFRFVGKVDKDIERLQRADGAPRTAA